MSAAPSQPAGSHRTYARQLSTLSPPDVTPADLAGHVWTASDLKILHQLQVPVAVVAQGMYSVAHSGDIVRPAARVLFQNVEAFRRFGPARSIASSAEVANALGEKSMRAWRIWQLSISKGETVMQPSFDVTPLLQLCFQGTPTETAFEARLDSKPIKVEISPGKVETAVLHIAEMGASTEDLRIKAQHHRNPFHTFMFNRDGDLLSANKAAMQACKNSIAGLKLPDGQNITLKSLFEIGLYPGGQEEAQDAYADAVNAIFVLQVDCHRHTQPHAQQQGKVRWEMIEMWPMKDPVTSGPAVLVKRYNITQQKQTELQLEAQQELLQRQNQTLEQDSVAMLEEKARLESEATALTQHMKALMHDKFEHVPSQFDAETPIDKVLNMMQAFITQRQMPSVETVLTLYQLLSESDTHLRQPVALEEQLLKDKRMDSDVGKSMLQLLQGHAASAPDTVGDIMMASQPMSTGSTASTFVPADITPAIERMLQDALNNWQFDIFGFADATPGRTLSMLTFHLYKQAGLIQDFNLDEQKLCNFLQKIESGYCTDNPYHNSIHAASVVQMTHMLLCHGGLIKTGLITKNQHLSSYWSAAVHDYEHGGLNNDFLIKTAHPLAILYNDQSPLENHHMSAAVTLLSEPDYAYIALKMMRSEALAHVRSVCINQVLGTDMKKHFDITSRFQSAFKRTPPGSDNAYPAPRVMPEWDSVKTEDKTLVYQMVLKCADIGHLSVDPVTHKRWAYQLEEEFFRQGDKEKAAGLPVSPLMDRSMQGGMTRSQLGFFNIVGIPLFKALADLFEDSQPMLDGVLGNFRLWEAMAANAS